MSAKGSIRPHSALARSTKGTNVASRCSSETRASLLSSAKAKQTKEAVSLKVTAARQLKNFPASKTFTKKEALQFVVDLLNQGDGQGLHKLVAFDSWFRGLDRTRSGVLTTEQMMQLVKKVSAQGTSAGGQPQEADQLNSMIKNAITPALIKQAIDSVWSVYDADGNGVLDMEEARNFVEHVLSKVYGEKKRKISNFPMWFNQFDRDHSGTIEKSEFVEFIERVARSELYGARDVKKHYAAQLEQGRHYIRKMVQLQKHSQLDYLGLCSLLRKVYRAFDLNGSAVLGKVEMKQLLEFIADEINTMLLTKHSFQQWFREIDADGNNFVTIDELVSFFAKQFKIPEPVLKGARDLPKQLQTQNFKVRNSLRKFAKNPAYQDPEIPVDSPEQVETSDQTVKDLMKTLWQQYDVGGNGHLNRQETLDFVSKQLKFRGRPTQLDMAVFDRWFKKLDRDGDGKLRIVEIANYLKLLLL